MQNLYFNFDTLRYTVQIMRFGISIFSLLILRLPQLALSALSLINFLLCLSCPFLHSEGGKALAEKLVSQTVLSRTPFSNAPDSQDVG